MNGFARRLKTRTKYKSTQRWPFMRRLYFSVSVATDDCFFANDNSMSSSGFLYKN